MCGMDGHIEVTRADANHQHRAFDQIAQLVAKQRTTPTPTRSTEQRQLASRLIDEFSIRSDWIRAGDAHSVHRAQIHRCAADIGGSSVCRYIEISAYFHLSQMRRYAAGINAASAYHVLIKKTSCTSIYLCQPSNKIAAHRWFAPSVIDNADWRPRYGGSGDKVPQQPGTQAVCAHPARTHSPARSRRVPAHARRRPRGERGRLLHASLSQQPRANAGKLP